MPVTIQIAELSIELTRKNVKNVHLSVHPPQGRVTLVAPMGTRLEVARAYAVTKLSWIRQRQTELLDQARESPRQFIERESHYLWGRRYLLTIVEREGTPKVTVGLLEYVIVHEMIHLLEPTHSVRFITLLNKHYPAWREARAELNELPLGAEVWKG